VIAGLTFLSAREVEAVVYGPHEGETTAVGAVKILDTWFMACRGCEAFGQDTPSCFHLRRLAEAIWDIDRRSETHRSPY
jgi:hypothetical protein